MKNSIFKLFGIGEKDMKVILSDLFLESDGVLITITEGQGDSSLKLEAEDSNLNFDRLSSTIFERLSNFIYAEENISLSEALFQLLKFNGLKLAVAESITAGNICATFVKNNPGASEVLVEGDVVYTESAKMRMLDVSEEVLKANTAVSAQTTYDMAKGLLNKSEANLVIATTGYAGGDNNPDNGLCYIAIGDRNKIDVYKNNFVGSRSEIIEIVTMASMFYLIKKLRKKDFAL